MITSAFICGVVLTNCVSVVSEENGAEKNIVSKDLINGRVQKGPFVSSSSVIIIELDDFLNQTGRVYSTIVVDNLGNFEQKNIELVSRFTQLKADGYYFNEITGKISIGQISLSALVDISESNTFNINVLTHLERARTEYLIKEEKKTFTEAKKQAQKEVLNIFSMNMPTTTLSESLNITNDAQLLAVSCILQGPLSTGELMEFMTNISLDIREDGILDNQALGSRLIDNALVLSLQEIRENIESMYAKINNTVKLPDFERYIQQFIENTSYQQASIITYPKQGAYGPNLFSDETTEVSVTWSPQEENMYSLTADIPVGNKLRVVLKATEWTHQAIPIVNWEGGYKNNNQIIELSTIEGGKLCDVRIIARGGKYNTVDKKYYSTIEYYENNSKEPRIKQFEYLTYIIPSEIDYDVLNSGVNIPYTDFVLNGACQWTNLKYDRKEVILINSQSDLEKYITCTEGSFAKIDFSKQTLLLASGASKILGYRSVYKRLLKIGEKYILDVGVANSWTPPAATWIIAIVVEKMEDTDIFLNVVTN